MDIDPRIGLLVISVLSVRASAGEPPPAGDPEYSTFVKTVLERLDTDGDGHLGWHEVRAQRARGVRAWLFQSDTDDDRKLSRDEIEDVAARLAGDLNQREGGDVDHKRLETMVNSQGFALVFNGTESPHAETPGRGDPHPLATATGEMTVDGSCAAAAYLIAHPGQEQRTGATLRFGTHDVLDAKFAIRAIDNTGQVWLEAGVREGQRLQTMCFLWSRTSLAPLIDTFSMSEARWLATGGLHISMMNDEETELLRVAPGQKPVRIIGHDDRAPDESVFIDSIKAIESSHESGLAVIRVLVRGAGQSFTSERLIVHLPSGELMGEPSIASAMGSTWDSVSRPDRYALGAAGVIFFEDPWLTEPIINPRTGRATDRRRPVENTNTTLIKADGSSAPVEWDDNDHELIRKLSDMSVLQAASHRLTSEGWVWSSNGGICTDGRVVRLDGHEQISRRPRGAAEPGASHYLPPLHVAGLPNSRALMQTERWIMVDVGRRSPQRRREGSRLIVIQADGALQEVANLEAIEPNTPLGSLEPMIYTGRSYGVDYICERGVLLSTSVAEDALDSRFGDTALFALDQGQIRLLLAPAMRLRIPGLGERTLMSFEVDSWSPDGHYVAVYLKTLEDDSRRRHVILLELPRPL